MTGGRIRLDNLTLGYRSRPAVHHLTGVFEPGTLTAVVGPNGSGKSTLMKGMTGFLKPMTGSVDLGGLAISDICYLPQQADLDRSFPISILDVTLMGGWKRMGAFRAASRQTLNDARRALAAVGLSGFEDRAAGSLSAGQFQRALFARALLQDAPLIILDEPFTAIDARTTADLLRVVLDWNREGRTVIAVIHDLDQVRAYFPRTLLLAREPVAWDDTSKALSDENLGRARLMVEAWDENAALCGQPRQSTQSLTA